MTEKQYVGDGITVLWHSDRCIHSAHCATTLPRVFRPQERPWIDVTGADASDIRATIDGCPSGALGYIIDDGPDDQQAEPLTESEPEIEAVTVSVTATVRSTISTSTTERRLSRRFCGGLSPACRIALLFAGGGDARLILIETIGRATRHWPVM